MDDNGKERSFNDFKKLVLERHPTYNQNYLQAEYQTAKASGQMAAKWAGFQRNKARYPQLKYKTVGDEHVRDDHAQLDGFIAHIDDPIWDRIYPPNDWRCRCYVVQTNEAPDKDRPDLSFMKPAFSVNVGKTGVVFNDQAHPYFVIPKKDEKRVQLAFESMKLRLAYGKAKYTAPNGHKVFVHPFADPSDLMQNVSTAVAMANNGMTVRIRPHVDANILKGYKNPEFKIGKSIGELKAIEGIANISKTISDAKAQCMNKKVNPDQNPFIVVFDFVNFKGAVNFKKFTAELNRSIHTTRGRKIKGVIVVYKDKSVMLTRDEIVKRDYSKLQKIQ